MSLFLIIYYTSIKIVNNTKITNVFLKCLIFLMAECRSNDGDCKDDEAKDHQIFAQT